MVFTDEQIQDFFTYHKPTGDQPQKYEQIREAGRQLAFVINEVCPNSADTSSAIRTVREAVMIANASIALEK